MAFLNIKTKMNKTMKERIVHSLVLNNILFITLAVGTPCPWTCKCEKSSQHFSVECAYDGLPQLPIFPNITTSITVKGFLLANIPNTAFTNLKNLQNLKLLLTKTATIFGSDVFSSLTHLTSLSLTNDVHMDISKTSFTSLSKLKIFQIHAGLEAIPEHQICQLVNVRALNFRSNNISKLAFGKCFRSLSNLNSVVLDQNRNLGITSKSFENLRSLNIRELSLRNCFLRSLDHDTFTHLPLLSNLQLGGNKLVFLPKGVFSNLTYLKVLQLNDNALRHVPCDPFFDTLYLQTLDLSGNKNMQVVFCDAFLNLKHLTELNLSKLKLNLLKENVFLNLTHSTIQNLYLNTNKLQIIHGEAFKALPYLNNLTLDSNTLSFKSIQSVFANVNHTTIIKITMGHTKDITTLNNTLLNPISNSTINHLKIRQCGIEQVQNQTFNNMQNLKVLDLAKNNIVIIKKGAFKGAANLAELYLQSNKMQHIPTVCELGISSSLQVLDLSYNLLKAIDPFECLPNLRELRLNSNLLRKIPRHCFDKLTRLSVLRLHNNKIQRISGELFDVTPNIQTLYLNHNQLVDIGSDLLAGLRKLIKLDMAGNQKLGGIIHQMQIRNSPNLSSLFLSNCGIRELPRGYFNASSNLGFLYMAQNRLDTFDPTGLENLFHLQLASNNLAYVSKNMFITMQSLSELDISGNPFACNCDLVWFRQWVILEGVFLTHFDNKKRYTCASPESQKGKAVLDMTLTVEDCLPPTNNTVFIISISLSLMGLVWTILIGITYRYRWHLRYMWHWIRIRRQRYLSQVDQTEYDFDAFVAYAETDRRFVIDYLLPELEYRRGFKLCIHHRNWLPGNTIIDNIVESVERSRKVIVVLSNSFAKRYWCQMELTMAQNKPLDGKTHTLIVILLENIRPENMRPILRHLLTTKTYIKWTENASEQKILWRNMRQALRKPVSVHGHPLEEIHSPSDTAIEEDEHPIENDGLI